MDKKQFGSKSNAHRSGTPSSGKHKGKGGGGGGKKPIKVLYISNPMRVTTSAAGFRALVQELTGRNADPSKYSGGAIDVDESSGGCPAEPQGTLPSPGSTVESSDAAGPAGHIPAAAYDDDDDDDSFAPQLIDNMYSVFSPPTFLYGSHNEV